MMKTFTINEKFTSLKKMVDGKEYHGKRNRHYGSIWKVYMRRESDQLHFGIDCFKSDGSQNWEFESKLKYRLVSNSGERIVQSEKKWCGFKNTVNRSNERIDSFCQSVKWSQMKKELVIGKLTLEFDIMISKDIQNAQNLAQSGMESAKKFASDSSSDLVVLIADKEKIYVSKMFLSTESTYFKCLLAGSSKLRQRDFGISRASPGSFQKLIKVLEGDETIDDSYVESFLHLAVHYQFSRAAKKCEQFLIEKSRKTMNEKLQIANKFGLDNLKSSLEKLDDSDMCVVSVESLRCTVCYEIFQDTPQTLQCGHTFCSNCIRRMDGSFILREIGHNATHCAMCRKKIDLSKAVPNYTLKNILDSIDEISKEEEKSRNAFGNTLNASNERLLQRCNEMEKTVNGLKKENRYVKTAASFVVGGLLLFVIAVMFIR